MIFATRYHDISCGHRVHGHESKCAHLHGHNYRVHFFCRGGSRSLDSLGRVLDFSVIKARLCEWLEQHWDHRFLAWESDAHMHSMRQALISAENLGAPDALQTFMKSIVWVPFNPTAENMAQYLLDISPGLLSGTGVEVYEVLVEETRKCSAGVKR